MRNNACRSAVIAYNAGIINNVRKVDAESSKIIVLASGIQMGDLPARPIAIGIKPHTVVTEVKIIGRKRTPPPLRIARHLYNRVAGIC